MKTSNLKGGGITLKQVRVRLNQDADTRRAQVSQRFFKTGPGEYGSGDRFLGVVVPKIRQLAKNLEALPLPTVKKLLRSSIHEERQLALFILVRKFQKADEKGRSTLFKFYVEHLCYVNNWDLVDGSAPYIVGSYLFKKKRTLLYDLAQSSNLWRRRVGILATLYFIKQGDCKDTLRLAKILLQDNEDLIYKAVGWMLREVGKKSIEAEERFLKKHYQQMPRTMLRYAIERFPELIRRKYLNGEI